MIQNYNGYRVLGVFLDNPSEEFGLREISRKIKLGLPSVRNYTLELEKTKLITRKEIKNNLFFTANRDNDFFRNYKKFHTINKLFDSGLIEYLDKNLEYPTIVLFGSHALGEDIEKSDIDLFIVSEKKGKNLGLEKFEEKIGKIHILIYKKEDLERLKRSSKELINSVINGIVLRGFLKILK